MQQLIGTPLPQVVAELEKEEQYISYQPFNTVKLTGDTITFSNFNEDVYSAKVTNEYWLKYFCNVAKIPFTYLVTLDETLQTELVNYHMPAVESSRFHGRGTKVLVKNDRDSSFGVVSKYRQFMRPSELLRMYGSYFTGETNVVHYSVDIDQPRFSILNDQWNMTFLDKSDVAYFGLSLDWHHDSSAPKVYPSSHRPFCGNLMNVPRNVGQVNMRFNTPTALGVAQRFHEAGVRAVGYVNNRLIPRLVSTTTRTFADVVKFLEQLSISKRTRELILQAFLEEKGDTVYHVIQACTYATTHYDLTEDEIAALNRVVMFLVDPSTEDDTCQLCHQHLE